MHCQLCDNKGFQESKDFRDYLDQPLITICPDPYCSYRENYYREVYIRQFLGDPSRETLGEPKEETLELHPIYFTLTKTAVEEIERLIDKNPAGILVLLPTGTMIATSIQQVHDTLNIVNLYKDSVEELMEVDKLDNVIIFPLNRRLKLLPKQED